MYLWVINWIMSKIEPVSLSLKRNRSSGSSSPSTEDSSSGSDDKKPSPISESANSFCPTAGASICSTGTPCPSKLEQNAKASQNPRNL